MDEEEREPKNFWVASINKDNTIKEVYGHIEVSDQHDHKDTTPYFNVLDDPTGSFVDKPGIHAEIVDGSHSTYTYEDVVKANPSYHYVKPEYAELASKHHMEFDNTWLANDILGLIATDPQRFKINYIARPQDVCLDETYFRDESLVNKESTMACVPDIYNKLVFVRDNDTGKIDFLGKLTSYSICHYSVNPHDHFQVNYVTAADLHVESIGHDDPYVNGHLTDLYNDINKLKKSNKHPLLKKTHFLPAPKKHPKKGPWPIELTELFNNAGVTCIIFSGDWTIVKFLDGDIQRVHLSEGSSDDSRETAILYCLAKHTYPNIKHDLHKAVKVAKIQKPHKDKQN